MSCYSTSDAAADKEASEMLTGNAQNLMQAVSEVVYMCSVCIHVYVCACRVRK